MDLGFTGKRVLVCAASRGIGFAVATKIAQEGAKVWLVSRSEENINKAAEKIAPSATETPQVTAADLSNPQDISRLVQEIKDKWGGVDVLINNVGGPAPSPAASTSPEAWQKGFEQLFLSTSSIIDGFLPGMREQKYGRIVTVSSISVVEPIDHLAVSTAMRSAVSGYCKTLATEVAADNITVNMVMPGVIHTERIEELRQARAERRNTSLEEEMENTRNSIPAKRLGKPEEIASLITYLSSTEASYITGQNIAVDGGLRKSY